MYYYLKPRSDKRFKTELYALRLMEILKSDKMLNILIIILSEPKLSD